MIKIIIFLCSLLLPCCLWAQIEPQEVCGSMINEKAYKDAKQQVQNKQGANVRFAQNITLKLQPHIIRRSNGTGGLSMSDLNTSIQELNRDFAQAGFYFDYCSPNYIDNDDYYNEIAHSRSLESQMGLSNNISDAVNVYFVPNAVIYFNGNPTAYTVNWGTFPADAPNRNWIVMNNSFANKDNTLAHEVGHYFDLYHTHHTTRVGNSTIAEHVERNTSDPCFNCETTGDLLCDTEADPNLARNGAMGVQCLYQGLFTDACGESYQPNTTNIMSYAYTCRSYFSSGQVNRMWTSLNHPYRTNLANSCSGCSAFLNITQPVFNGQIDIQSASSLITASNSIFNGGVAVYDAGNEVVLRPGFEVRIGGNFDGVIEGCSNRIAQGRISSIRTTTLDVELEQQKISLTIFPNPTIDQFELKFSNPEDRKFVNIRLINLQGQLLKQTLRQEDFLKGDYAISITTTDLPSGVYFLQLLTDKDNITERLVVLKK